MSASQTRRMILVVAASGSLCFVLIALLSGALPIALADGGTLFASQAGSGSACEQSDPCDLQTALEEAWTGETIYVAGGTYTGAGLGAVITVTRGITLVGGWDGNPAGPIVRDPTVYPSVLDGEMERRVIFVSPGIAPTIAELVIENGNASQGPYARYGGGIYSSSASPRIIGNVIRRNIAHDGPEWAMGGGIYFASSSEPALIAGNVMMTNTANTSGSGKGGGLAALYNGVEIRGNRFQGNVAGGTGNSQGGGLYLESCPATIRENLIQANQASRDGSGIGGGLYADRGEVTLNANRIVGNAAMLGALTLAGSERVTLTNNLVVDNVGGIYADGGTAFPLVGTLANNTIARNGAEGIFVGWYNWNHATLTLTNNIIVSHTTGIFVRQAPGNRLTARNTLFYGNGMDTAGSSITSTEETIGLAPGFTDPASGDFHLRWDSPAVDAGSTIPWLTKDMDGDLRPSGQGYDIGADELHWYQLALPMVARVR